ncbi:MAG: glycosyltransferase family 2 protein, partial [Casimicrobiaceae bacterium]
PRHVERRILDIERALRSVAGLCPVVVVDSGSTDATVSICERHGARVLTHRYENHAAQWAWALEHLPVDAQWVLALDADFEVTPGLRARLEHDLAALPADVAGVYVVHRYVFGGTEIRFGGAKKYWLRLIRRGYAAPDLSDLVDFRFVVRGRTVNWRAMVREYNLSDEDASFWIRKQDKFSLRLAVEEELRRQRLLCWDGRSRFWGNSDERVRWLRDRWLHLPLFLRPVLYFFYRYVVRLGFLDGAGGFLYHAQQGFWLRLTVDWKLWQLRRLNITGDRLLAFRDAMLETSSGSVPEVWRKLREMR